MKSLILSAIFLGIISVITTTDCTTARVADLLKNENETLELYVTKLPYRNYTEICYIQTDGAIFHTPQKLLDGLKTKAKELNADVVINIKYDFQAWYPLASGIAIKYNEK